MGRVFTAQHETTRMGTTMPEFSDAQIESAITSALAKQDINAVPGLITLLALQNPHRADMIRQTILYGLSIAANTQPSEPEPTE